MVQNGGRSREYTTHQLPISCTTNVSLAPFQAIFLNYWGLAILRNPCTQWCSHLWQLCVCTPMPEHPPQEILNRSQRQNAVQQPSFRTFGSHCFTHCLAASISLPLKYRSFPCGPGWNQFTNENLECLWSHKSSWSKNMTEKLEATRQTWLPGSPKLEGMPPTRPNIGWLHLIACLVIKELLDTWIHSAPDQISQKNHTFSVD